MLPDRFLRTILKIFYRLLYHRMAWTYDFVSWGVSVGLWKNWVQAVIPMLDGPRLLELGHGPGHLQTWLLKNDSGIEFAAGLDRSYQMGQQTKHRLIRKGLPYALANGEAQHLPFATSSFDQVVATFPTEYIADPHTLAEVGRVLAADGSLVVLLGAWITGRRLRERAAAALFRITGQAPDLDEKRFSDALSPAASAGFDVEIKWINLETSRLAVVVARKNRFQGW